MQPHVNSALHPSGMVESNRPILVCLAGIKVGRVYPLPVQCRVTWQVGLD